jgi:antitoxin MazE
MATTMKARIVKVGNSRGVRIPKVLIEQLGFGEEVEMIVQPDQLVIRSPRRPRAGWRKKFEAMAKAGDDRPLDAPVSTQWDEQEWTW